MAVNHAAEAIYASSTALQDGFRRMQAQSQMLTQKNLDGQALAGEGSGVATQRHSVSHPAQASAHFSGLFNEWVSRVEIDIGKGLVGEVADGQHDAG